MEGVVILRACRDSVWPRSKFGIDDGKAYERDHVRCRLENLSAPSKIFPPVSGSRASLEEKRRL